MPFCLGIFSRSQGLRYFYRICFSEYLEIITESVGMWVQLHSLVFTVKSLDYPSTNNKTIIKSLFGKSLHKNLHSNKIYANAIRNMK